MKPKIKLLKIIVFTIIAIGIISCSKSDDPVIKVPTLKYPSANFSAAFFKEGSTSAPSVDWNGDTGTFALASTINGISIENTTGIVSWDKSLPLGDIEVEIVATNSAGKTSVKINVENIFQGTFKGGFNHDPDSTIINSSDTTYIFDDSGNITSNASFDPIGKWNWDSGHQVLSTEFTTYIESYQIIYNNGANAHIEGLWAQLPYNDGDPASGYVKFDIVE